MAQTKETSKPKIATESDYPKGLKDAMAGLPHVELAYVKGGENGHWHFVKPMTKTQIGKKENGQPIFKTEATPGYSVVYRSDILTDEMQEA
jgi:hypothetical protein